MHMYFRNDHGVHLLEQVVLNRANTVLRKCSKHRKYGQGGHRNLPDHFEADFLV